MLRIQNKGIAKKMMGGTLIAALLVSTGVLLPPRQARAVVPTLDAKAQQVLRELEVISLKNAAVNTSSAVSNAKIVSKEFWLDWAVWLIKNIVLPELTKSIVDWANSGFDGSPSFVSNYDGFFFDVADKSLGAFISSTEFGFMCSQFRPQLEATLELIYRPYQIDTSGRCTLTGIIENAEDFANFVSGDFLVGGWDSWFSITTQPQNNFYGAALTAEAQAALKIETDREREVSLVTWGGGFLSWTEEGACTEIPEDEDFDFGGETVIECEPDRVQTPGGVISEQLNTVLPTGMRQLEIADEINEIVGALLVGLLQEVLLGEDGLLGTSEGGYLDDVAEEGNDISRDADVNPFGEGDLVYTIAPPAEVIIPGERTTLSVTLEHTHGDAVPITISIEGLPSAVTVISETNNPCGPPCTMTFTLEASSDAPERAYPLSVAGSPVTAVNEPVQGRLIIGADPDEFGLSDDMTPPVVTVTKPFHNAQLLGSTFLEATADDLLTAGEETSEVEVVKFQVFRQDTSALEFEAQDTTPAYSVLLDTINDLSGDGRYELRVEALDHAGNNSTPQIVRFSVSNGTTGSDETGE